jgi:hypothetical protein
MNPKIGQWVWHYADIYPSGQHAALVVVLEGARPSRGTTPWRSCSTVASSTGSAETALAPAPVGKQLLTVA